ncbi:MAG: MFS transporter [Candidatus Helarchaeota archaeon]
MSNFLSRLEIEMEKKIFSFLIIFFLVFIGIDIFSLIMVSLASFWIIYWYLIPLIVTLVVSGVIIDKVVASMRGRAAFLLLLIPEGALTMVLGINIVSPTTQAILWIFIGILSGFTIVSILAFLADITTMEQRGKVAGFITGIAWMFAAVFLSWISSTIVAPSIIIFIFALIKIAGGAVSVYIFFAESEGSGSDIVNFQSSSPGFGGLLKESYKFIWTDKKFLLYMVAFMLLWLAQGIYLPIGGRGQTLYQSYQQIASIGFAAGALFLIISGFLLDTQGRKQILVYGILLTTISFLSYYFPIGSVFLSGFVISLTTIIVVLGDLAPSDAKGRYYSIFFLSNFTAFLVGFLLGLIIGNGYGFQLGNYTSVALACVIISAIAFVLIYLKGAEPEEPSETPSVFPTSAPEFPPLTPSSEPSLSDSETSSSDQEDISL